MTQAVNLIWKVQLAKKKKSYLDERTERVDKTVKELKSKHGVAYNGTQYRFWAEAFVSGQHSSTDEPPVGSMWKKAGEQTGKRRSSTDVLSEALSSVAKAITSAMQSDKDKTSTPPRSSIRQEIMVSPGTKANLQIDQIDRLHQLMERGAITKEQFIIKRDQFLDLWDHI